ncbi:unnamed protein product [Paramecium sonneborni]|uniref:Cyclic nucleotide-binding domain-containing protein n=1 Tax=Paramecium sonneborni TaxID=65129 RepID=A0A8S1RQV4_9CILI|nr:unnamed protein product [Paramecium sonneborni]
MSILTFNSVLIDVNDPQHIIVYSAMSLLSLISFSYLLAKILILLKDDELDQQLSQFMTQNNLDSTLKENQQVIYFNNENIFMINLFFSCLLKIQINKLIFQIFQQKYYLINYRQQLRNCMLTQLNYYLRGYFRLLFIIFYFRRFCLSKIQEQFKITIFKQYDLFGEIGFYTQKPRNFTIKSDGVTRLLKLERTTFLKSLNFNDKQLFQEQRDKILFNIVCCLRDDHILTGCPLLTYKPNQSFKLKKFIFPHQQIRKQYKCRLSKDMRALQFYQCASQYEVAFLNLFQDQLQISQFSQSQIPYDDLAIGDSNVSARSVTKLSRNKSFVKSTSFMKQQSGYEQQSIPNHTDNLLNDQQKRTFATSGFGSYASNKDQTSKSLNIIVENEDSDSISESKSAEDENVDDSPQDKFERKNNDPKLTFNYNFETQMNELQKQNSSHPRLSRLGFSSIRQQSSRNSFINKKQNISLSKNLSFQSQQLNSISIDNTYKYPEVISQRLNSSRSLTYSPIPSNKQIKSGIPSSKQNRKSTFSFPQKLIQQTRQVDITNFEDSSQQQQQRHSIRKISTKTGTKISILPSCFQPFSYVDIFIYILISCLSMLITLLDQIILTLCIHLTITYLTIIMKQPFTSLINLDLLEKQIYQSTLMTIIYKI